LVTAASVNDGRIVLRRSQTERSASDADDNRTALYAPPTARFTDLGMSVSLPIFIQIAEVQRAPQNFAFVPIFSREPSFLLLGLSYMKDLPPERADSPRERIGGVDGGGG